MADTIIRTGRDKSLYALQQIQLEGLKEIDRICRKHDIKYSLGGGTCLGQIRHGGFIPWDDDIDIDMTTENYEKFIEVAPKETDTNRFFLRTYKTDKNFKRSFSRFELKNTDIGTRSWERINLKEGIFVDIFEWNYLPNNKFLRNIVSNLLFIIRWLEMYKMLNAYTLAPRYRVIMELLRKIVPFKLLYFLENKLKKCCGKKRTDWIIDNAVINGNHGGYPSEGIDEYKDVQFEGITVMNKKNPENFMKTIYGKNYNKWLPPVKRISHHKWSNLDFGDYKNKYDLPEDYNNYLTVKYTYKKLEHMQNISFEMLDKVNSICNENNIKYYLIGINSYIKYYNINKYGKIWREPLKIAMPRNDYNKFAEICQKYLGKKYFYQSNETDKEYKYSYARIRLNLTSIRESKVPKYIEEKYNEGFFIKIIPLENTSNNEKERKKHAKRIRYLNHFIVLKWQRNKLIYFFKGNIKIKIKLIMLIPFSLDKLINKLTKERNRYNNCETNYYIDGTGYQFYDIAISKDVLGKGDMQEYNEHNYSFPTDLEEYMKIVSKKGNLKSIEELKYIKYNYSYFENVDFIAEEEIKKIQRKYPLCYLNYFDMPDYQLSVLRYDEKEDRFMTDDEILNTI